MTEREVVGVALTDEEDLTVPFVSKFAQLQKISRRENNHSNRKKIKMEMRESPRIEMRKKGQGLKKS